MAEIQDKVIFRIQTTDLANIANKQAGAETVVDADLGFKMYGYKDSDGTVQRFLVKDKPVQTERIQNKTNDLAIGDESTTFVNIKNTTRKFGIGTDDARTILDIQSDTGTNEHIKTQVGSAKSAVSEIRTVKRVVELAVNEIEALFTGLSTEVFKGTGWISVTGTSGSANEALATVAFDSTGTYIVPISGVTGLGTAKNTANKVNFYTDINGGIFTLNIQNKSGSGSTPYKVTVAYDINYHLSIAPV